MLCKLLADTDVTRPVDDLLVDRHTPRTAGATTLPLADRRKSAVRKHMTGWPASLT